MERRGGIEAHSDRRLTLGAQWDEIEREDAPFIVTEHDLEDGWTIEYAWSNQEGSPVIVALRLGRIDERPRDAPKEPIPPGGITAAVIRQIRLSDHQREDRERLLKFLDLFADSTIDPTRMPKGPGGRPRQWTDAELAHRIAKPYVELRAKDPRKVAERLEDKIRYGYTRTRDLIRACRERGILSPTVQGRAGGELTPYGRQLLSQPRPRPKPKKRKAR